MRKKLLVSTLKILQLLGTLSPKPPTGAPPLDAAMVLPHPKPPSAAYAYRMGVLRVSNILERYGPSPHPLG